MIEILAMSQSILSLSLSLCVFVLGEVEQIDEGNVEKQNCNISSEITSRILKAMAGQKAVFEIEI